jgi:hypothetical protein
MECEAIPVENPRYMDNWEMEEQFWGNFLLISNIKDSERNSGVDGGVVRYYSKDTAKLYELIMEMDKDGATYGSCMVRYIGGGEKNSVGGVFI